MRTAVSRWPWGALGESPPSIKSLSAAQTASRADSLASGATESSRSSTTTSQGKPRAFSSIFALEPGTNSTLRRALACKSLLDAFAQDEPPLAHRLANGAGSRVFRRIVASQRFLHGWKLNDHVAGAGLAFQHFGSAA